MGIRLGAGTLDAMISRLESRGLIEPLESAEPVQAGSRAGASAGKAAVPGTPPARGPA